MFAAKAMEVGSFRLPDLERIVKIRDSRPGSGLVDVFAGRESDFVVEITRIERGGGVGRSVGEAGAFNARNGKAPRTLGEDGGRREGGGDGLDTSRGVAREVERVVIGDGREVDGVVFAGGFNPESFPEDL